MNKSTWGTYDDKLKYTYENEADKQNGKVIKKQMSKEELEDYLKGLELKCKWKQKKHF